MNKVSMLEASKLFNVSRPTLLKHLQNGKISGEKETVDKNTFWKLDVAELSRVYKRREAPTPDFPQNMTNTDMGATAELQAEIKLLQAKLEAAEKLAAERALHLDDLRKLLERPNDRPAPAPVRRWWHW